MDKMIQKKLIIAGGGTGGHVLAGIAVANVWEKKNQASSVLFIGARGRFEEKWIPQSGYSLKRLSLGGLNRVTLKKKILTLLQLPIAFMYCVYWLIQFKPTHILGVGSYSSGPVLLTAWILNRLKILKAELAILEQNSIPGLTHRILGILVKKIFIAYSETEAYFPKNKVYLTGNPIRFSIKKMPPALHQPFTIFVFGGSQGAVGINQLVIAALEHLKDYSFQWIHQTGRQDYHQVKNAYLKNHIPARVEPFIETIAPCYQQASLLICRAGASTLAEISAVGRAAILIPLPTATHQHQLKNAQIYARLGASILFEQNQVQVKTLVKCILELAENPQKIRMMEKMVTKLYRPNAAKGLVDTLLNGYL